MNPESCSTPPDQLSLRSRRRLRWLLWGGMAVFLLGTAIIAAWVYSHDTLAATQDLHSQLAAAKPWLLLWRLVLLSLLIGAYAVWVNALANFLDWPDWRRQHALSQRLQVALLFVLVELLFAQRGLENGIAWWVDALSSSIRLDLSQ